MCHADIVYHKLCNCIVDAILNQDTRHSLVYMLLKCINTQTQYMQSTKLLLRQKTII